MLPTAMHTDQFRTTCISRISTTHAIVSLVSWANGEIGWIKISSTYNKPLLNGQKLGSYYQLLKQRAALKNCGSRIYRQLVSLLNFV